MKYILIAGKKGSGKDYFGEFLNSELIKLGYTSEIDSFANPIKEIVSKTFEISIDELDKYKNNIQEIGINSPTYDGYEFEPISDFRSILQRLGTEAIKPIFGDDIWAKLLYNKARTSEYIIVTDFRFLIEYYNPDINDIFSINILGGIKSNQKHDTHSSETELKNFEFDMIIDNSEKKDLSQDIKDVIQRISK